MNLCQLVQLKLIQAHFSLIFPPIFSIVQLKYVDITAHSAEWQNQGSVIEAEMWKGVLVKLIREAKTKLDHVAQGEQIHNHTRQKII